ncbi:hypothetical protein DPMN_016570 [Dreissena polymorpha]|uniref:Uncharacterized protein n=1 Tax=Dreissena polymorpha TaxID=45954 RepID=A0A9D4NFW3_DREPO|nr:hypothetical protein DPMN_016570 [Dreissena polymorpha]
MRNLYRRAVGLRVRRSRLLPCLVHHPDVEDVRDELRRLHEGNAHVPLMLHRAVLRGVRSCIPPLQEIS